MNTARLGVWALSALGLSIAILFVPGVSGQEADRAYSPYVGQDYPTQVYWGDTHLHTSLSVDAFATGGRLTPEDAYRFAMWRFSKTNGITEGFHNKMEMISRRAYGFRNFENYRLRVLTHCGWDGIINRVRMDARPPLVG